MQYGHFNQNPGEYVITTPETPRHWYNYMFNEDYVSFTSQTGMGQSFAQDRMGRRISLIESRAVYLADGDGFWTASGIPVYEKNRRYECTHGLGYTSIETEQNGILSEYSIFIPPEGYLELWTVKVKNLRDVPASIKVIPYFSTNFDGIYVPQCYNMATSLYKEELSAVFGKGFTGFGEKGTRPVYAYMTGSGNVTGFDSRKNAFIGVYGNESLPEALMKHGGCTNSLCCAEKLCFALQSTVELSPGQSKTVVFAAGVTFDFDEVAEIREKYFDPGAAERVLESIKQSVDNRLGGVKIHTPDHNLNSMFGRMKYQCDLGSYWARVRHNGYRDITQDADCLAAINPHLSLERLERIMEYQYSNGYAPRTFIDGRIHDRNFADNTVWLTFTAYDILMELGDLAILDREVAFNDGSKASLYEHIKRSVQFLADFTGHHGLVRIWGGDWNDCIDQAGVKGQGVSVWLSIAWYWANKLLGEIAELYGKEDDAALCRDRGENMRKIIEEHGWDGEYYLYGIDDIGRLIVSHKSVEGQITLNPQTWAVLSGISKERAGLAMDAVDRELERPIGTLVSWTPYGPASFHLGHVGSKPPGVNENGGVYLHASMWKLAADAVLKRHAKVEEDIRKILPYDDTYATKYCEPYILPNCYFSDTENYRYGTPGQSFRTAANQWFAKALVTYVFGLRPRMEGLSIDPCLPPMWKECAIEKQFRGAVYNINYRQEGSTGSIKEIRVNGAEHNKTVLPYEKDGKYDVEVVLG
ncbi:MAG: hypothetical protein FWH14_06885 [Oscillospiraceae bacterium]|nr:hypothetical protein [Oscillospiraceae bacterium]